MFNYIGFLQTGSHELTSYKIELANYVHKQVATCTYYIVTSNVNLYLFLDNIYGFESHNLYCSY